MIAPSSYRRRWLAGCLLAAFSSLASANPSGGQVVSGSAAFQQQGATLTVSNSRDAIINWQQFSIAGNETTRFIQPDASSSVLNRITGQDPSQILGQLQSNGRVYLLNPNGFIFGSEARIDVAGLIASTLDLRNSDFLAGKLDFAAAGAAGRIDQQGRISTPQGGFVYLIAPDIRQDGVIVSPQGEVLLAAGRQVQLVDAGDPALRVTLTAGGEAVNVGRIVAQSGRVGLFGAVLQQQGLISASRAERLADGGIVLRASERVDFAAGSQTQAARIDADAGQQLVAAGKLDARNENGQGGGIQLTARQVGLSGSARLDASGAEGGAVRIGGDWQGANGSVRNAEQTSVLAGSEVRADGQHGDGGSIVVWADGQTRAYGRLSATGGRRGGLAEVSGKAALDFAAQVDLRGQADNGRLLLDPRDIFIDDLGDDSLPRANDGSVLFSDKPLLDYRFSAAALAAANADISLQATRDIEFRSALDLSAGNRNLKAIAGGAISVLQGVSLGGGSLDLQTKGLLTVQAPLQAQQISLSGNRLQLAAEIVAAPGATVSLDGGLLGIGSAGGKVVANIVRLQPQGGGLVGAPGNPLLLEAPAGGGASGATSDALITVYAGDQQSNAPAGLGGLFLMAAPTQPTQLLLAGRLAMSSDALVDIFSAYRLTVSPDIVLDSGKVNLTSLTSLQLEGQRYAASEIDLHSGNDLLLNHGEVAAGRIAVFLSGEQAGLVLGDNGEGGYGRLLAGAQGLTLLVGRLTLSGVALQGKAPVQLRAGAAGVTLLSQHPVEFGSADSTAVLALDQADIDRIDSPLLHIVVGSQAPASRAALLSPGVPALRFAGSVDAGARAVRAFAYGDVVVDGDFAADKLELFSAGDLGGAGLLRANTLLLSSQGGIGQPGQALRTQVSQDLFAQAQAGMQLTGLGAMQSAALFSGGTLDYRRNAGIGSLYAATQNHAADIHVQVEGDVGLYGLSGRAVSLLAKGDIGAATTPPALLALLPQLAAPGLVAEQLNLQAGGAVGGNLGSTGVVLTTETENRLAVAIDHLLGESKEQQTHLIALAKDDRLAAKLEQQEQHRQQIKHAAAQHQPEDEDNQHGKARRKARSCN